MEQCRIHDMGQFCFKVLDYFKCLLHDTSLTNEEHSLECLHGSAPLIKVIVLEMGNKLYLRIMN